MVIREVTENDLSGLLELYMQLHDNPMPCINIDLKTLWNCILDFKDHHVIIGVADDKIISSCVLVIVRNLTHNQRPYALVENVVTDENNRNKGYGMAILNCAKEIAIKENCYKIMLMTGSKEESTLRFYERAGYNRRDKTAFIQHLACGGQFANKF